MTLDSPVAGLLSTPPSVLPYQSDVLIRSYLLSRPDGDILIYNSPGIAAAASELRARGGVAQLLVNHAHEAMFGDPAVDVAVFAHELDRAETARGMTVAGTFSSRHMIGDDLEVIPTPGHTPGTTSYLWDDGAHRFLFTGDFIWIEHGDWKAVVLDRGLRGQYLESLALVRDLDFDVLVPWGATDDGPPIALTGAEDARARIDAMIARLRGGADR